METIDWGAVIAGFALLYTAWVDWRGRRDRRQLDTLQATWTAQQIEDRLQQKESAERADIRVRMFSRGPGSWVLRLSNDGAEARDVNLTLTVPEGMGYPMDRGELARRFPITQFPNGDSREMAIAYATGVHPPYFVRVTWLEMNGKAEMLEQEIDP